MLNLFDVLRTSYIIAILYPRLIFDEIKNAMHYSFRLFELLENGS
jgi:hypothetical protein